MDVNIKKFLFENRGTRQTIFKNTFWLGTAEGITSFLRFALVVWAARVLGSFEYGKFAFGLSFVSLFAVFSDIGLSYLITREFSKEREKEKEYPAIISLKIVLSVLVLILTGISSFFITKDNVVRQVIWILMIFIFVDGFFSIVYPFLRARQKMEYEALTKIAQTAITVILGVIVILTFPTAVNVSYAYLLASVFILGVVVAFFHFFIYFLKLSFDVSIWKKLLGDSWSLIFGFTGAWMYINLDSTMIGFWGSASDVGWFNAASKIVLAIVLLFAGLVSRSFFPTLSKLFKESKSQLQKSWDYYVEMMLMLALPLVVGGIIFASKIIDLLYGLEKYSPSVLVFQILITLAGISFICYPFSMILIVSGHQKKNFFVILSGILVNAIISFILMLRFGILGVATGTIIAAGITFLITVLLSKRYAPINPFNQNFFKIFGIAAFSSALMAIITSQSAIYHLHLVFCLLLGAIIYFASYFGIKKFFGKFSFNT